MEKNTGKVREKSGNFVSPEKWEPCIKPCSQGTYLGRLSPGNRGQQTWQKKDNKLVAVAIDTMELSLKMCFAWILCQYWLGNGSGSNNGTVDYSQQ